MQQDPYGMLKTFAYSFLLLIVCTFPMWLTPIILATATAKLVSGKKTTGIILLLLGACLLVTFLAQFGYLKISLLESFLLISYCVNINPDGFTNSIVIWFAHAWPMFYFALSWINLMRFGKGAWFWGGLVGGLISSVVAMHFNLMYATLVLVFCLLVIFATALKKGSQKSEAETTSVNPATP